MKKIHICNLFSSCMSVVLEPLRDNEVPCKPHHLELFTPEWPTMQTWYFSKLLRDRRLRSTNLRKNYINHNNGKFVRKQRKCNMCKFKHELHTLWKRSTTFYAICVNSNINNTFLYALAIAIAVAIAIAIWDFVSFEISCHVRFRVICRLWRVGLFYFG